MTWHDRVCRADHGSLSVRVLQLLALTEQGLVLRVCAGLVLHIGRHIRLVIASVLLSSPARHIQSVDCWSIPSQRNAQYLSAKETGRALRSDARHPV